MLQNLVAVAASQCAEWYAPIATPQEIRETVQANGARHRVAAFPGDTVLRVICLEAEGGRKIDMKRWEVAAGFVSGDGPATVGTNPESCRDRALQPFPRSER